MAQKKVPKEYRQFCKDVKKQNFSLKEISDGFQIVTPDGKDAVTFHITESNPTLGVRRTAKRLEKYGFKPGRRY
jgi:hypothetical protein